MSLRKITIVVVLIAALGIGGTTAFTSASMDRDVSVTVNSDNSGVVQIAAGEGTEIQSGQLVINAEQENLNVNATFVYGDNSNPSSEFAFSITNADDQSHNFTFSHNGPSEITYTVHDGSGNTVKVSNGASSTFENVSSGETLYVTMAVKTPNSPTTLTGSITIKAD